MAENGETKPAATTATPTKPAAATPPAAKPAAKAATGESAPIDRMRRRFIWAGVFGYLGVNLLMFLRFFFPRALFEPSTVFSVGYPTDFALGVDERFLMTHRVWVVREPDRIFAITAVCTHLGCTPEWKSSENKFKCPCHGSGYDSGGVNFEGPAPRPMDRAHIELDPTGRIMVDTSRKYVRDPQAGINNFDVPGAFISV
jgi:cytochrome b6-f complex iron-sulfur subunit